MIITETVSINEKSLVHTFSDSGYMIKQNNTDIVYSEAYDQIGSDRSYTETNERIVEVSLEEQIENLQNELTEIKAINNILLGTEEE